MERVTPASLNYDNILPLAVESRSNRREFRPVNGQTFTPGGTNHIRIDVNADSMLDALNSYLSFNITEASGVANSFLGLAPFGPAIIQRLRIESGGVVIEDIDEYSRLYAMTSLCQCPADYLKKNYNNMGMYQRLTTGTAIKANNNDLITRASVDAPLFDVAANSDNGHGTGLDDLIYPPDLQGSIKGAINTGAVPGNNANNQPTANGLLNHCKIQPGGTQTINVPLLSGFLNMDKYIPLIMMNAGFTLDIELVPNAKIGVTTVEAAGNNTAIGVSGYSVSDVKYVAHLIDLDRSFYDKLRAVMDSTGGVLQLAGQTYRHYVGNFDGPASQYTVTLPARVKSVKSIFATFHDAGTYGTQAGGYSQSVFQNQNLGNFRFEIGSVRYPQTDINCRVDGQDVANAQGGVAQSVNPEFITELQKAFGKLGDYQHQMSFSKKNLFNVDVPMTGTTASNMVVSAYILGFDFEAFQRVALEAGINTADRSLPINCILTRHTALAAGARTRGDFYVLTDAIYYISLDGTVSVSV